MSYPASGKHRCLAKDKNFAAVLGTGTAIKVAINGKMNGLLGGFAITGFGSIEYTYVQGATEWVRTELDGSAQGPASIPVGSPAPGMFTLVYDPAGKCNAKVSIEVTGDADVTVTGFQFKHKKDVWKMKGRTDKLNVTVSQDVGGSCDNPDSSFTCADYESAGGGEAYCVAFRGCTPGSPEAAACGLIADEFYLDAAFACV